MCTRTMATLGLVAVFSAAAVTWAGASEGLPKDLPEDLSEDLPDVSLDREDSFYGTYVKGRLHIGASYAKMSMDETSTPHEKAYLGNLDTLREKDTDAFGITVKYDFCKYLAVMFSDDMHAELSAWNNGSLSSDGILKLDGYTVQAIGQYPWEAVEGKVSLTPYVGLGFTDISASWSHADWWHYGWPSPEVHAEWGSPSWSHSGYTRWMLPEDPPAVFTYSAGLAIQLYRHLDIDFFYRVVDLDDVKTNFRTGSPEGHLMIRGAFPASFSAYGVALRYVF